MKLSRRHFMATAAAASVAPTVISATQTQAAAPMVGKQAPGFYRFKVGEFEVTTLNDGFFSVPEPAKWITNKTPDETESAIDPQVRAQVADMEERFRRSLGTRVTLNRNPDGSGRLVVHFYSDSDLNTLFHLIADDDAA
jgi:hypothetical protein